MTVAQLDTCNDRQTETANTGDTKQKGNKFIEEKAEKENKNIRVYHYHVSL